MYDADVDAIGGNVELEEEEVGFGERGCGGVFPL